ncbi:MAG: hypothetical protein QMC00_07210 [Pseudomonadales bacterium]|jgi:hypothetical protein|tara:strand:+ start:2548 stop:3564 length:1017 start_codon:yes stop_codon:yes gene_type:complete
MNKVKYSKQEIEADHDYQTLHVECGQKLHGGFDPDGHYLSPRTKHRWDAINNWHKQLEGRGVPIVEASTTLLTEPNFPNVPQQVLLLKHGIEQSFWDSLTITGLIEARGKALAELQAPDFQMIIVEDISSTALAHLNKGLLTTHGWDEGGIPDSGIGGHDTMWFAARDLVFGKEKFPIPAAPASIGREKAEREMLALPAEHEMLISFLMNLLMIEVRAERAFDFYERVIASADTFIDKPKEAAHAVELINRIRLDESVHVAWLRAAISEFRSFTIKAVGGAEISGAEILDPVWEKMVHWHAVEMHEAQRPLSMAAMKEAVLGGKDGQSLFEQFQALVA